MESQKDRLEQSAEGVRQATPEQLPPPIVADASLESPQVPSVMEPSPAVAAEPAQTGTSFAGSNQASGQEVVSSAGQKPRRLALSHYNRVALLVTGAAIVAIALIGLTGLILSKLNSGSSSSLSDASSSKNADNYSVSSLQLGSVKPNQQLQLSEADHLSVNGQLKVSNTLVLTPTGTPSNPTKGQIYFSQSTNQPYYYNGSQFVSLSPQRVTSLGGVSGVVGLGQGLSIVNNQLAVTGASAGVSSLTGTANQINVSHSAGNVTLSLPQSIATSSAPTFNGEKLTGQLSVTSGGALVAGPVTLSGLGAGLVQSNTFGVLSSGSVNRNDASFFAGQLSVANGGTGAATFTADGVLYGNGTGAIQATGAATNSVLISDASGVPILSQTLPLAVQNNITHTGTLVSGAINNGFGTISTVNNITTTALIQGGSLKVTGGNFTVDGSGNVVANGAVHIQGPGGLNLGVAGSIEGSAVFANTSNSYTTTLQAISPSSQNQNIVIPASTAANDQVCLLVLSNCTGSGSSVGSVGSQYYIAKFTNAAANQIGNSLLYDNGTSVGVGTSTPGASYLLDVNGTLHASGAATLDSGLTVTAGGANITGNFAQSGTGTFSTGTGAVSLNGATTVTGGNTLAVSSGATSLGGTLGVTGAATFNGGITVSSGATITGLTNINVSGTANTFIGNSTGSFGLTSSGLNVTTGGAVSGVTGYSQASGNFTQSGTGTFSTGTGAVSLNGATTAASTLAVEGSGGITVGVAGTTAGVLNLANATNSNLGILQAAAPSGTGNASYTLPSIAGGTADTVCLETLGNCSGATGTAGGDLTGTYPNPTIAKLQGTTLTITTPATGQFLQYNGTAWVNQAVSGDITIDGSGIATIGAGKVTNTDLANSSITVNNGTNITGGTTVALGGNLTLGVISNPTFTGLVTASSSTTGLAITGTPASSATSSLIQVGNAIAGGNTSANGGTYLGLNEPGSGAGSAADFLNFQVSGTSKLQVTNSGAVTAGGQLTVTSGGVAVTGNSTINGTLTGLTGLTSSGTVTFSGLNSAGVVHNNASGTLSTGPVVLGTDTSGNYVASLGSLTGLSVTGNSGAGSTPSLSVTYGSSAGTAVQGNTTLVCPSGSGNLSGGGNTVTLGAGGTCNNITITNSPVFTGTLAVQGAGGITVGVAGTTAGVLNLANATNSNLGILQAAAPSGTGNASYTLPSIAGGTSDTVCLVALGNCAGSGGGITGSGTTGAIAKFSSSGSITSSTLSESGSTVTASGNFNIQGSNSLTLGEASTNTGSVAFANAANAYTLTLQAGTTSGNLTFTLPTADGSNGDCLVTNGAGVLNFQSCTGGAGSVSSLNGLTGAISIANATAAGSTITINDASTTGKGIAEFNSTDFTVSGGIVDTVQSIATGASPTFAGLSLGSPLTVPNGGTGKGTLTANGILYGNGTGAVQSTSAAANSVVATNGTDVPGLTQTLPTAVQGNITGTGVLSSGSIGSGFGTIATGNSISTTAALSGGTLTVGSASQFQVDGSGNTSIAGSLTVGVAGTTAGVLNLANATNSNLGILQAAAPSGTGNASYTLPSIAGGTADTVCLETLGNCSGATGTAGGDLTGTYPNPTIAKLQGTTLTITSAATGQVLNYNGTAWVNTGSPTYSGDLTVQGTGTSSFSDSISATGTINTASSYQIGGSTILQAPVSDTFFGAGGGNTTTTGGHNIAIGNASLHSVTSGGSDIALGTSALNLVTTGQVNTAVGYHTLIKATTGNNNTAVGGDAGVTTNSANADTTGSNNTFLGYATGFATATQLQNASAIGTNAVVGESNALVLGCINGTNGCTANTEVGVDTATPGYTLDVAGDINTSTQYRIAGTVALTSTSVNGLSVSAGTITNPTIAGTVTGSGTPTITGFGTYNNQTIGNASIFTGDVTIQGSNALSLGVASSTTGAIAFYGSGGTNKITLQGPATPSSVGNYTLSIPAITANATICTDNSICAGYASASGANYIAKNAHDTSTAAYTGNLLDLTNSSTGAAGVLSLTNSGTNSALNILQTGTSEPGTGQALIMANNNTTTPAGNLLDLQSNGTSELHVDVSGNLTTIGNIQGVNLTTTGTATIGTLGTSDTSSLLCRNSSNQIAACSSSGTGAMFVQGGNSFGATALLGTNDNYGVNIESNGTVVTSLNTSSIVLGANHSGDLQPWQTATPTLPTPVNQMSSVTANGYVYVFGGSTSGSINVDTSSVEYAKLNADGSIGTWQTATSLPDNISLSTAVEFNGYAYVLGGHNNSTGSSGYLNTVYYAKLNPVDGSVGTWQTTTTLPVQLYQAASVVANGYLYEIGGNDGSSVATVYYAKINPDGTIGSWTSANSLPAAISHMDAVVANGYLRVLGNSSSYYYAALNADGSVGTWTTVASALPSTCTYSGPVSAVANGYVYLVQTDGDTCYATLNADGTVGSWSTTTGTLPTTTQYPASVISNGYIYIIGGKGSSMLNTTYYASTERIQVGGSLDLVGLNGGSLADTNSAGSGSLGGSLTAGDTNVVGTLQVQGQANFTQGVGIGGSLTVGNTAVFQASSNSTSAFEVQNASDGSLLSVDSTHSKVVVGYTPSMSFATNVDYTAGNTPEGIATADFNGDGYPDIVTVNYNGGSGGSISVYMNNGNGTFAAPVTYTTGSGAYDVAVGDFNGDGYPDIAVANKASNTVSVFINSGTGTFASAVNYAVTGAPEGIAVGDFNGDGHLDIATADYSGSKVSILMNNGDGTFATHVDYAVGSGPDGIAVGDFNGDGHLDIATANYGASTVSILMNNGDGTFATKVNYPVNSDPRGIVATDFNGDGYPDIATTSYNTSSVSVLLNNGDGTFGAYSSYTTASSPYGIVTGDFNGDGNTDLAVSGSTGTGTVSVLPGNGDGTFATYQSFAAGSQPHGIAAGDFNGDGEPDLATANKNANTTSVLLNTTPPISQLSVVGDASVSGTLAVSTLGSGGTTQVCLNGSNQISTCSSTATETLQQAYALSTSPQITLNSTQGGLVVQDGSTPLGADLFTVQNNGGTTKYLSVNSTTTTIDENLSVTGTINTASSYQIGGTTELQAPGTGNTFVGHSGNSSVTGSANSAVGASALQSVAGGYSNSAFGQSAMAYDTSGVYNASFGNSSLRYNTSGSSNAVLGAGAGMGVSGASNVSGNSLLGYHAGYALQTGGNYNTLLGYDAGNNLTTGAHNIIIGDSVSAPNVTGSYQLDIGSAIYGDLSTGSVKLQNSTDSTTAFQVQNAGGATILNTDTTNNGVTITGGFNLAQVSAPSTAPTVAVNTTAGNLNGTYYYTTTFVTPAGETNFGTVSAAVSPSSQQVDLTNIPTSTDSAVTARKIYRTAAGGSSSGPFYLVATINDNTTTTYTDNVADTSLGAAASNMNSTGGQLSVNGGVVLQTSGSGIWNTAFGNGALQSNTVGTGNTAVGSGALSVNTSGYNNAAIGTSALNSNTTGYSNESIGVNALQANTSGHDNISVGTNSLFNNLTGINNIAIGSDSLNSNTTGNNSTAVGVDALQTAGTTASDNTAFGQAALQLTTTGSRNVGIGEGALYGNTTGSYNASLGYGALATNTTGQYDTAIGYGADVGGSNLQNATAIGYGATVSASNTVVLGNTSVTCVIIGQSSCTGGETFGVNGSGIASGGFSTGTPDMAEYIDASSNVTAQDVVIADSNNAEAVTTTSTPYDPAVVGVIANGTSGFQMLNPHYGQKFNALTDGSADPNAKPMTVAGRVPVKVTGEGGPIKPGDYLTTSSTSGYAMKADHAGPTIGKALGFFSGTSSSDTGSVLVLVTPGYYGGPSPISYIQNGGNATLNNLTVGGTADFADVNISGTTTINNLAVTGSATIATLAVTGNAQFKGNITVDGHIITAGGQPVAVAQTAAGAGAAVRVNGDDTTGTITITTGSSGLTAGDLANITFSKSYAAVPHIVISGDTGASAASALYPSSKTTSGFQLHMDNVPAPNTTYKFDYFIAQ